MPIRICSFIWNHLNGVRTAHVVCASSSVCAFFILDVHLFFRLMTNQFVQLLKVHLLINFISFTFPSISHKQIVFKRYGDVPSSIKLKVRLPIADITECKNAYKAYNINLGAGQVCAGGMKAKDSCLGDSGDDFISVSLSFLPKHLIYIKLHTKYIQNCCGISWNRWCPYIFWSSTSHMGCVGHRKLWRREMRNNRHTRCLYNSWTLYGMDIEFIGEMRLCALEHSNENWKLNKENNLSQHLIFDF